MAQIYEGMFVLDNELVRESWPKAKASVGDLIAKHGGTVHTSRRWAERRLAYPIKDRLRATYLLAHYEIPPEGIPNLVRDLDLSETLLRYLILRVDDIPAEERELSAAEDSGEAELPTPPEGEGRSYRPLQSDDDEEEEAEADDAPAAESKEPREDSGERSEVPAAAEPVAATDKD